MSKRIFPRQFFCVIFVLSCLLPSCTDTVSDGTADETIHEDKSVTVDIFDTVTVDTTVAEMTDTESVETAIQPIAFILPDGFSSDIENADTLPLFEKLAELTDGYTDLSIYYTDTEQQYYFAFNADYPHEAASAIKPLYCDYLVYAGVNLQRELPFEEANRTSTSGMLSEEHLGESFTVDSLIQLALTYSDNMAYRLLFKTFTRYGFNRYIENLGLSSPVLPTGYEFSTITAHDLSIGMVEVYRHSLDNSYITDIMKGEIAPDMINGGVPWQTATKYGYHGGYGGYHDTAIVYAPKPYVLTIMTRVFPYENDANDIFIDIAAVTDEIHTLLQ